MCKSAKEKQTIVYTLFFPQFVQTYTQYSNMFQSLTIWSNCVKMEFLKYTFSF